MKGEKMTFEQIYEPQMREKIVWKILEDYLIGSQWRKAENSILGRVPDRYALV